MTLKEQFIDAFKSGKRFDIQNAEVIADEFAIGFAEWAIKKEYHIDIWVKNNSTKELLEIYKKENGL
jgi:hypothetical protein